MTCCVDGGNRYKSDRYVLVNIGLLACRSLDAQINVILRYREKPRAIRHPRRSGEDTSPRVSQRRVGIRGGVPASDIRSRPWL